MTKLAYKIAWIIYKIKSEINDYKINRLINKAYKRYELSKKQNNRDKA